MARTVKKQKELTPEERLAQALVPVEDQPYSIPGNWCWTTIENINSFHSRSLDPRKYPNDYYELYSVPSCDNDYPEIIQGSTIKSSKQVVAKDDVLICKINPRINRVWKVSQYTDNLPLASSEWIVVRNKLLNPDYLKWYFKTPVFRKYMLSNVSGVGGSLMRAQPKYVKTYPVPIPPLAEQQRIVDRIDSLFSKLEEAKEKAQSVIDSFEDRKTILLHDAFRGNLTSLWREENGITIDSWESQTIGDLFTHSSGKALKKSNTKGELKKYITTSNLYWGYFDFSEVREMYFEEKELEKCTATKGDLLLCNGGDVGRASIWNYDYDICLQNHVSRLRRKHDEIDLSFFFYFFMFQKLLGQITGTGIGIASLSAKSLLSMRVETPSYDEQKEIAVILGRLISAEEEAQDQAQKVVDTVEIAKKAILSIAFRGELGTSDLGDEPAKALLERIL